MWIDPKNTAEWLQRFREVQIELDAIEIPDPLVIAPGEILDSTNDINRAFLDAGLAFKQLGTVKDKCRRLSAIAERNYINTKAEAILEAGRDRDNYPSDELRKAYGEVRAKEHLQNWQAAKVLSELIHDQRSLLFNYRKDLENIGHNVRKEMDLHQ